VRALELHDFLDCEPAGYDDSDVAESMLVQSLTYVANQLRIDPVGFSRPMCPHKDRSTSTSLVSSRTP
jgi:hypothetical protein